jgi:hypothetical protein
MFRKIFVLLSLMVIAAFALSACGLRPQLRKLWHPLLQFKLLKYLKLQLLLQQPRKSPLTGGIFRPRIRVCHSGRNLPLNTWLHTRT